jgi:type II secretory pathway pseudopilin PulG
MIMSRYQARRTRSLKARRFARGVGLVEVMIALVILAIGFLALGQLQSASVRSAAEARTRTAAVNLAVDKLDELRSFYSRISDADGNGTRDLVIDTDGDGRPDAVAPSFDLIAGGSDTPGEVAAGGTGFNFTRNWQVTPCTLSQAGVVACGGTLTMATADFARVSVRVQWNAADGATATQEVVLEDLVSSTTPMDAAVALSNPATSRESPKVYIQPARIQSTIPIAIGDDAASAASDPQPAIIRDNIVRTQFEVLTFSGSGNDLLAERAFDYTVIGCDCRSMPVPTASSPARRAGSRRFGTA